MPRIIISLALVFGSALSATAHAVELSDLVAPGAKPVAVATDLGFTEGPALAPNGDIYFSDIPNTTIYIYTTDGELEVYRDDMRGCNGLCFDAFGNLFVCETQQGRMVSMHDPQTKRELAIVAPDLNGLKFNAPNDLWMDRKGGIYFTDPPYGRDIVRKIGANDVYYISPDRKAPVSVATGFEAPNGIVGSADNSILYVADLRGGITYRFQIEEDGTLSNRKVFAETGSDGMAIDAMGNLYITRGNLKIFAPDGSAIGEVDFPEAPANLCFGGPDGMTLFVTARTSLYTLQMQVAGQERAFSK